MERCLLDESTLRQGDIGKWMKKAYESALAGATVVCLVPARTDTAWWFDYCAKGEIRFIKGRLKFGGSKNAAPLSSALIVFSANTLCKGIVKHVLLEYISYCFFSNDLILFAPS